MKKLRFVIIGAGMSGILALLKLKERGHEVIALEKASNIGGTWRENRYPGLCCDTPSHTYTFSFEPNPGFTRNYVSGAELQDYFKRVVRKYDLEPHIRFGREVTSIVFNEGAWTVSAGTGETFAADAVVIATGVLHHPRMPDIAGLDSFAGPTIHTALWPDDLDLSGKRIGVIGNGSTGVQLVSALAGTVPALIHFQRSPQWIMPQVWEEYPEETREAFRRDPGMIDAIRTDPEFLARVEGFNTAITDADSLGMKMLEDQCRSYLENTVKNPDLREKLRPTYRAACKRIVGSPDYYDKVQLPGVEVVTDPIERIESAGVRLQDGKLIEIDVLVLATGFNAHNFIRPAKVVGRDGVLLDDVWAAAPTAYNALAIANFPNLFMLNGPSAPVGNFSLTNIAEDQWGHIEQLLEGIEEGRYSQISPTVEAMADYREAHKQAAKKTIFASGCSSWYLDAEGIPMNWPYSYKAFREAMATPKFDHYETV